MNRYHESMEHCAPPPELEEQLREAVLSAEPEPQARTAVYRPRGFFRKALLAAVLIVSLTVSAGAVVIANWDAILASRFGEWAASTPMGQAAFQEVYVTSVCDDVTLTVRQALVSEKTVYLVLDYQLPDTVDREAVQRADQSDDDFIYPPEIGYYLTGDFSWADFKAADLKRWHGLDWSDFTSYGDYFLSWNTLQPYRLSNFSHGSSGEVASQGYDPETNTLAYLCSITAKDGDLDFTAQPLTVMVLPPQLSTGGQVTALATHPAILTFQPEAVSQTWTGSLRQDSLYAQVTLSPFAISVKLGDVSAPVPYESIDNLLQATTLVCRDGTTQPVRELATGLTGSTSISQDDGHGSVSFTSQFQDLLDVSQVAAVQVGDIQIPLE